jgi:hypothetical protein
MGLGHTAVKLVAVSVVAVGWATAVGSSVGSGAMVGSAVVVGSGTAVGSVVGVALGGVAVGASSPPQAAKMNRAQTNTSSKRGEWITNGLLMA